MSLILGNSYNENDTANVRDYSDSLQDSKTEANLSAVADTFGYYMDFNGTNAHYSVDGALSFASAFTIYLEFYTDDATTKTFLHSRENHSYIFIEGGRLTYGIHSEATAKNVQTASNSISTATWYKVACVYNGSSITVYLNGTSTSNLVSHALTDTNDVFVGSEFDSTNWYNGRIREYLVYDDAKTANEINALSTNQQGIPIGIDSHSFNVGDLLFGRFGKQVVKCVVFASETNRIRVLPESDSFQLYVGMEFVRFGHRWDTARQHFLVIDGEQTNPSYLVYNDINKWTDLDSNTKAVFSSDKDHTLINHRFELAGLITPPQITVDQNDYNPTGLSTAATVHLDSSTSVNLTGIQAPSPAVAQVLILVNVGSGGTITLKNNDSGSAAANRFLLSGDLDLIINSTALIKYDTANSRWRAIPATIP